MLQQLAMSHTQLHASQIHCTRQSSAIERNLQGECTWTYSLPLVYLVHEARRIVYCRWIWQTEGRQQEMLPG